MREQGIKMRGQIWGVLILSSLLISATLRISSDPPGAQIYLDGNYSYRGIYLGNAGDSSNPLVVNGVSDQRHFLQLVLPDYMIHYQVVDLSSGGTIDLSVRMPAKKYEVYTTSSQLELCRRILWWWICSPLQFTNGYSSPFAIDYNRNGTLDLLIGSGAGYVYYFPNRSSTDFRLAQNDYVQLQAGGTVLDVGERAKPFAVDFDNDGDYDLLVGNSLGEVWYFENQNNNLAGGVALTADGSTIQVPGGLSAPFVVDYNQDFKKDLVVSSGDGYAYKFLNIGNDSAPVFTADGRAGNDNGPFHYNGAVVGGYYDLDRDGDLDFGWAREDGLCQGFLDNSEGILHTYYLEQLLDAGTYASVSFGDVNGDQQMDLIFGREDGYLVYYISQHLDGDIIWDGKVDGADWARLRTALGCSRGDACYLPDADLNDDDIIDSTDEGILLTNFGRTY